MRHVQTLEEFRKEYTAADRAQHRQQLNRAFAAFLQFDKHPNEATDPYSHYEK